MLGGECPPPLRTLASSTSPLPGGWLVSICAGAQGVGLDVWVAVSRDGDLRLPAFTDEAASSWPLCATGFVRSPPKMSTSSWARGRGSSIGAAPRRELGASIFSASAGGLCWSSSSKRLHLCFSKRTNRTVSRPPEEAFSARICRPAWSSGAPRSPRSPGLHRPPRCPRAPWIPWSHRRAGRPGAQR